MPEQVRILFLLGVVRTIYSLSVGKGVRPLQTQILWLETRQLAGTNGTDKFALTNLTFAELTVAQDATTSDTTNISVTATGEYLMTITGLDYGYITTNDFISVDDIV